MTDAQLAALCAAIVTAGGGIAAALKWGLAQLVASYKDNAAALREVTAQLAIVATKVDGVAAFVERLDTTPVEGVKVPRGPNAGAYGPQRPGGR